MSQRVVDPCGAKVLLIFLTPAVPEMVYQTLCGCVAKLKVKGYSLTFVCWWQISSEKVDLYNFSVKSRGDEMCFVKRLMDGVEGGRGSLQFQCESLSYPCLQWRLGWFISLSVDNWLHLRIRDTHDLRELAAQFFGKSRITPLFSFKSQRDVMFSIS
ncbi:hypothetical protein AVEN_122245-1 [Araneus ventricosus]|uniref:Uncharacterized protein n=1 Tax=Araneus ventricosus TaxID=182803 RepID=A0A4Y2H9E2_ARAVE|nr:hypothetical protein AVEN_122245-1 [Araneus ventricosus]